MKDIITIIAEKPSVATEIGRIVGADEQHRDGVNGYVEGNGYAVTWAFGHLVTLKTPEEMGFGYGELPMLPEEWKTKIVGKKDKDGKTVVDPAIKKQLDIIKRLFSKSKTVIIATDAGREGELIFRYIYEYLGVEVPQLKRLWISALTKEDIREGLENLRDASEYAGLNAAAHLRSQSDWLIGYNASKALRLATLSTSFLSLGRVQTPTLGLICERFKENKNFVPTPFWKVEAETSRDGFELKAVSERDYKKETDAEDAMEATRDDGVLRVTEVSKRDVVTRPPLLYDLTSLQRAANSRHGLTAAETLKTAQSLYEKKLITYPRTGSSYIPETVYKNIQSLMQKTGGDPTFAKAAEAFENARLSRRCVDDSKVTDHHALLPTGVLPENITSWERIIWEMITERMYQAFGRDSISEATTIHLEGGGVPYLLKGSVMKTPGWKSIGKTDDEEDRKKDTDDDDQAMAALPHLEEGDCLKIEKIEVVKKTDKPKPIHTDSSLLKEMQTCGKNIEDEQAREAMKDVGLGTPATRDETIERMIRRGYVIRDKRKLLPTNLGQNIWEMVKGRIVANVETTGEWERDLALVEQGKLDPDVFDAQIREHTRAIVEDLKENCKALGGMASGIAAEKFECPFCGTEMKQGRYSIRCEEESGGCGYKVYKEVWGKKLSDTAIRALCAGKMTGIIKGFTSKNGKKFDAALAPDEENKGIKPVFPEKNEPEAESVNINCPCCGQKMEEGKWSYECACGFTIKKAYGGITLTAEQLMNLADGKTVWLKHMKNSKGKHFDAGLKADTDQKEIKFKWN